MISTLVRLHSLQKLHRNWAIKPGDVPLTILSLRQMVLKVKFGCFLNDIVVRVLGVHDQALCFPRYILRIQLVPIFTFLITRSEPIWVIGRVPITSVVVIVIIRLCLSCSRCSHFLLLWLEVELNSRTRDTCCCFLWWKLWFAYEFAFLVRHGFDRFTRWW